MTHLVSLLSAALLLLTVTTARAEAPVPLAAFFTDAAYSAPALAPDARSLAVLVSSGTSRDRLAVIDLTSNTVKVVAEFTTNDVGNFQWVNNQRLLYDSRDRTIAPGDEHYAPGLFAVNRDGSGFRRLADVAGHVVVERVVGRDMLPWNTFMLHQQGAQDSDFVYVRRPKLNAGDEVDVVDLLRLDTVTGRATTVNCPGNTRDWLLDNKGEPRLTTVVEDDTASVHYRDPASGAWRKLVSYPVYLGAPDAFTPMAFAPDGTLYVNSDAGSNFESLRTFDFATSQVRSEPVVSLPGYDFSGRLISTATKLLGIRYQTDAIATVWFDPAMKAVQAAVDKLLPATINSIDVARRAETPNVLVKSYSDRQPLMLSLYNTSTGQLNPIGRTHAAIDPARMAAQDLVHYPARDGLSIPAWLTVPNGSAGEKGKLLPLVVLVHGGPFVRGQSWGWDAESQFLASRATPCWSRSSAAAPASGTSTSRPAGSNGAWPCRTTSPIAYAGPSPRASSIPSGCALPGPVTAATLP